jgi:hypothetical protein
MRLDSELWSEKFVGYHPNKDVSEVRNQIVVELFPRGYLFFEDYTTYSYRPAAV